MKMHDEPTYSARIVVAATAEPISLAEAREHLRVVPYIPDSAEEFVHPDDQLIMAMLSAAREHCEAFTGLSLAAKTYEQASNRFPCNGRGLPLLHPPLIEVETVTYGNRSNDVLSPSDFSVNEWTEPQSIYVEGDWPSIAPGIALVRVRFRAGYRTTDADSDDPALPLPFALRAAILLTLGHLYENREATTTESLKELPLGVEALLRPLRVRLGMA